MVYVELFNFNFFSITGRGIDMDYRDIESFVLEMNRDHSVVFEIASKYCISVAQRSKHLPPLWETWVRSLGQEDPLEKQMVTHFSIPAWRILWMEKPVRLQSMESQRVRHD